MSVITITSREFREHQKSYFDLADQGQKIILKRGKKQSYVLTPISDDDLYFTPEMLAKIDHAVQEIKDGKGIRVSGKEEQKKFLDRL